MLTQRMQALIIRDPEPLGVVLCYSLEAPSPYQRPADADECATWLIATLQENGAPMAPRELIRLAAGQAFSQSTLYRARRQLGHQIVDTSGKRSPRNRWALPDRA